MQRPVSDPAAPMAPAPAAADISEDEYGSIEAAMMESDRGRRFLQEFARRNRSAETRGLLDAVRRLERALSATADASPDAPSPAHAGSGRGDGDTSLVAPILAEAVEVLDCVSRITAHATRDIRAAAARVQETAWRLQDTGDGTPPSHLAAQLQAQVDEIDEITAVEAIATQRVARVSHALQCLRHRLDRPAR